MQTPASIKKHPLHPVLIAFPIGLWGFSLICDLISLAFSEPTSAVVAFYTLIGGLVGAIIAAIPGVMDMLSLSDPKVKRIALIHMSINIAVVIMYAINLGLRLPSISAAPGTAIGLSAVAFALLGVSGWLGGEMVHVHGVSVANAHSATPATDKTYTGRDSTASRTTGKA